MYKYGVAKKLGLTVLKISPTAGSLVYGLGLVLTDLRHREEGLLMLGRIDGSTRGGRTPVAGPEFDGSVGLSGKRCEKRSHH